MIIGVDIGTSLTKAVVFDKAGMSVASACTTSEVHHLPGGLVEQDLDQVLGTVATVVRKVAAGLDGRVTALALTGQGDGLWLRDESGEAVRPAISWLDGRANSLLAQWQADGVTREVFRRTASGMFPGCAAAIMSFLDIHEPESLDRAAVAGYCVDAVLQRLTGEITVDASDASLPFLDPATRRYDEDAIAAVGLSHRRSLFAEPAAPKTVFRLDERGAALLGLPVGLPVSAGPFDLPASAIGAGVRRPGDGILTAGTTLACQVLTDSAEFDPEGEPAGMFLCTPEEGEFLRAMPAMVGTAGIDWVCRLFGIAVEEIGPLLDASRPGAGGVRALPFLSASGERAPFVDASARAQFSGLSLESERGDIVRALCESIAYAARHCFDAAGLTGTLYACGGGVRSLEWTRIFADVLGRPIVIPGDPGVGARGAVIVAADALGEPVDRELWADSARVVEVRPGNVEFYEQGYADYQASLAAARGLWRL
ncbi:erythritol kinase [Amycolatopsis lurida]|uniref:Erythritol kinase n=1 Tax=Amycolatopsis lurida NRRL 2430 TaxID=1460371 RepID=A0A2P2FW24_AMYLU|nr:FGGY-family carbohydrate kinase [Amycolatopsis lurida]KFU80885.1 erythritol kinase [Amycolatopsis lurida NRRL 2430]SED89002.1 erythritol kinase [Amycolatopsis lurida]